MIGLPMLSGFVGEFLVLSSTFGGVSRKWAILATLGVILGAAYMLWLVQRLFYGPISDSHRPAPQSTLRFGQLASWPLAVLMLLHRRRAQLLAAIRFNLECIRPKRVQHHLPNRTC